MAEKKVIEIVVNDDKAIQSVNNLNQSLDNTDKATENVNKSMGGLTGAVDGVAGGAVSKFKSLTSVLSGVAGGFRTVGLAVAATGLGALLIAIVAIKSAFTSSEEGQNKWAAIMGVIGSVVGNVTDVLSSLGDTLISTFTNPVESIKKFGAFIKEQIVNRFVGMLELFPKIGKAIGLLFSGEFKKAGQVAADAIGKVTTGIDGITAKTKNAIAATKEFIAEIQREARVAAGIAKQRAEADKLDRKLTVQRAEADRDRQKLLEKSEDRQKFSQKERIQFLREASKLEEDITDKEIKAAKLRLEAKQTENTLSKSNKEALDEEAKLKADLINLETAKISKQKEVTAKVSGLVESEAATYKAAEDSKRQARAERIKAELELERQRLLNIQGLENDFRTEIEQAENEFNDSKLTARQLEEQNINDYYFRLIETAKQYGLDTEILEQAQREKLNALKDADRADQAKKDEDAAAKKIADAEAEADRQIAIEERLQQAKKDAVRNGLSLISNLATLFAGQNEKRQKAAFKVQKAVNIANATIDTYKGAVAAFASAGNPIVGAVFAAATIAAGLVNIAKIKSTQFQGGGGGGGGSAAASFGAVATATQTAASSSPNFNVVGDTGVNQLNGLQQPIKAYVVGGEVTTQQQLDRSKIATATL